MRLRGSGALVFFGMPSPRDECVTVGTDDLALSSAAALPSEPDAVQDVALKISARLLDAYAADGYSVQGHECSIASER